MIVIAMMKAFSGEEWVAISLRSIYKHVDAIIITLSDISWIGGHGNPCMEVIESFAKNEDPDKKIILRYHDTTNQLEQCNEACMWIKNNFDCDYIMFVDTDEVWDNDNLTRAIDHLKRGPRVPSYRCRIHTYIKGILFRVDPPEPLMPVVFVDAKINDFGNQPRGCDLEYVEWNDVYYHHYIYVRHRENAIFEKIIQSHISENQPYHNMSKWIPEVWNKIPYCDQDFHPAIGYEGNWKKIKILSRQEMPEAARSYE